MSWLLHASLLDGWLPFVVDVAAATVIIFGIPWSRRPLWQWAVLAFGVLGLAAAVNWVLDLPPRVGGTYPPSFLAWAALPFFVLVAFVVHWPGSAWWRRVVALVAVPIVAAFGLLQVDAHYQYVRTIGALVGEPVVGQVAAARVTRPISAPSRWWRRRGVHVVTSAVALPRLGVVAQMDIPASRSHFAHRQAYVWLPPAYFERPTPQLPVLMLLSGFPGTTADWIRAGGALEVLNGWASTHHGMAPAVVFPDANGSVFGDTECVDGPNGAAETYLTVDVPAFMRARFGTATSARNWGVAGLSEGGTCALDLAARHPKLFETFGDYAGDPAPSLGSDRYTLVHLYGGNAAAWRAHDPDRWFGVDARYRVAGYVVVGASDGGYLQLERSVMRDARAAHLEVHYLVVPGGHDFAAFATALRETFPWMAARLERAPPTAATNLLHAQPVVGRRGRDLRG